MTQSPEPLTSTPPAAPVVPAAAAAPAPPPGAAAPAPSTGAPEDRFGPLRGGRLGWGILALLALVLAAYLPVLRGGDFIHEDYACLTAAQPGPGEPPVLPGATWLKPRPTLREAPLTYAMLQIEWRFFGPWPIGYHAVSVGLHAAAAVAIWLTLRRLRMHGAWLAAALVAVHPALAEAVGWIGARGNVLALLFFALAMWQFARLFRLDESEQSIRDNGCTTNRSSLCMGRLGVMFLLVVAALGSAPALACTLPLAFPLVLWWRRRRWDGLAVGVTLLMLLAGLAAGLAAYRPWGTVDLGELGPLSWVQRAGNAEHAAEHYVGKLFWPLHLTLLYPKWEAATRWESLVPLPAIVVMGVWGLFLVRRWVGRGLPAGVVFFLAALLPALGLLEADPRRVTLVADHWGYLAGAGLLVLVAGVVGQSMRLLEDSDRWLGQSAAVPLVGALCFLTFQRSLVLANPVALWEEAAVRPGASYVAHDELGNLLRLKAAGTADATARGYLTERAIRHYREAIRLNPEYARPYNSLGQIYQEGGKLEEALRLLSNGRFLNADDPVTAVSLANVICSLGKYSSARGYLERVLEDYPKYAEAHLAMGAALRGEGELVKAARHFQEAAALQPANAVPHNEYGVVLMAQGKFDEARKEFARALDLRRDYVEAHNNLGICLARSDMRPLIEAAVEHYRAALALRPDFSEARKNMASAYLLLGEPRKALAELERVHELNPKDPENLAARAELLATTTEAELRNLPLAVALADQAADLSREQDPMLLAVAARVHAVAGQFGQAITLAEKALALATQAGNRGQMQAFKELVTELERAAREEKPK